jgi:hypothetical protein
MRWQAEADTKRVKGVAAVANDIEVRLPALSQRLDPDIARDIVAALKNELPYSAAEVKAVVKDGWVTLNGVVEWNYPARSSGSRRKTCARRQDLQSISPAGSLMMLPNAAAHCASPFWSSADCTRCSKLKPRQDLCRRSQSVDASCYWLPVWVFSTLAPAVDRTLDPPYILQEAVSPRWTSATPEQQSELQPTFRSYTIATYVANFDGHSGDRFELSSELREAANGDQIVHTRFVPPSGDARVSAKPAVAASAGAR